MPKRTVKKVAPTAHAHPTSKRRWSKAHSVLVGVGVISSAIILTSLTPYAPTPGQTSAKPDFTVTSAGYLSSGDFGMTIKNNGAATTTQLSRSYEWQDGAGNQLAAAGVLSVITLQKGASMTDVGVTEDLRAFLRTPPEGAKKMRIVLDAQNRIPESNETNNTSVARIDMDLGFANAGFSSAGALSLNVTNAGPATVPDVRVTVQWLNASSGEVGAPLTVTSTKSLGAASGIALSQIDQLGKVAQYVKTWNTAARKLRLSVTTVKGPKDVQAQNNTLVLELPKPNLSVGFSSYAPGSALTFKISNTTLWGAANPLIVLEWRDEKATAFATCAPPFTCPAFPSGTVLAPGASQTFQLPANSPFLTQRPAKAAKLYVSVRPDPTQGDSNMVNNTNVLGWPLPDLQVSTASFDALKNLHFSVKNGGQVASTGLVAKLEWLNDGNAPLNSGVQYNLSAAVIQPNATLDDPGILVGAVTYYISMPPPGAKKLRIAVDPADAMAEASGVNNEKIIPY